jgi:hypothetical protein
VALLGPDGSELSREATARTALGWSCPPDREPSPRGLVLQPDLGRFAIRLDKQQAAFMHNGECWWTYSLADGKRGGELTLAAPARTEQLWYFAVDADAVPGTELTLITWSRTDWRPNSASDEGCRLSLVDKAAREVWSLQWATEFKGVQYFSPWDGSPRGSSSTSATPGRRP